MTFSNIQKLLAGTLALVLVAGMTSPAFAGQDTTPPNLICPANVTLQLGDSSHPVNTGVAVCNDMVSSCDLVRADEEILNQCGVGTILRTWIGTDAAGNVSECVQTITIEGECIAGELLPIMSSALVIAGVSTIAIWMIPAVLGLAGVGVYLVKFRANKE